MIEVASAGWVLAGTGDSIAASFYADGEPADPGTVTVDLARADGTVLDAGRATGGSGPAPRTVVITPDETAALDILTLTWHATIDLVPMTFRTVAEVVGGYLFTVAEARTYDKRQLADDTAYPDTAIEAARGRIADAFGRLCGVEFIPRYRRVTLDGLTAGWGGGPCGAALALPDARATAVRSVDTRTGGTATWAAFGAADLAGVVLLPEGLLYRESGGSWPRGYQNVRVGYECGHTTVPLDIKRAALILAVNQLVPRDIGDRALSLSTEVGTFRIATAGDRNAPFGLPLVDSVIVDYARRQSPLVR